MRNPILALRLIALLAAPGLALAAGQHAHPAPTTVPAASAPAHRYATDATLRQQMRVIRSQVAAIASAQQRGEAQPVVQGAARITAAVNTIIVSCKLPPDSDAALHEIIGPILQHAAALKAHPAGADAVVGLRHELASYARAFSDPGFAVPAK